MTRSMQTDSFEQEVRLKYQVYNSLFLTLPFDLIHQTGTLLPLLTEHCQKGYREGKSPEQILHQFFTEFMPDAGLKEQLDVSFNFIKYIERQVVLFDAIEEAAFEKIHDIEGAGTLPEFLARVEHEKVSKKLRAKLDDFRLRIVLTAHPTQFYPGTVLGIITDLATAIKENHIARVKELLLQLGKTPFINETKPTPLDEARSLIWYLRNVFYHAVPEVMHKLQRHLDDHHLAMPDEGLIDLGFWPGGDRDGNPFVNIATTMETMALLHRGIMSCYHYDIRELRRRLTFKGVHDRVVNTEYRLFDSVHQGTRAYASIEELIKDLEEIRDQLNAKHAGLFADLMEEFLSKVRLFGFHFAILDIRQDSRKHEVLIETLFKEAGKFDEYSSLDIAGKIDFLEKVNIDLSDIDLDDDISQDIIESIRGMYLIQDKYGRRSCHRYIISNSRNALDVVIVRALFRLIHADTTRVDIVPLFESVDTLKHCGEVMEQLYTNEQYAAHLKSRSQRQTVMLGFSDGTKDGGYLRANWSIFRAKERLSEVARKYAVDIVFFDGRGGPPARGGGNTHKFYSSLGATIDNHEVQVTVQGQTISSHYGSVQSAVYNLEQLFTAGLEQSIFRKSKRFTDEQVELLSRMANAGYKKYGDLKGRPEFLQYLEEVGTLDYYGQTNIGSRPVKRGGKSKLTLDNLRAIPFVSSWSQLKQNIPGYYGFGYALEQEANRDNMRMVRHLYRSSRFFQTLVGNSIQSLRKCFFPLTAYLQDDASLGEIWNLLHEEYELSLNKLTEISRQKTTGEDAEDTSQSIAMREMIILPVLTIQQAAIQKLRNASMSDKDAMTYRKLVLRSMYGIINAGRNSA